MSFTGDVKKELSAVEEASVENLRAFAYGFLLFGKSFNGRSVRTITDYECVARAFSESVESVCGITQCVTRLKSGKYSIRVSSPEERFKLITYFDHNVNDIQLRINHGVFETDESYNSFLRGVFLACGTVANPDRGYHLEFVVPHLKLSSDLLKILTDKGLDAKRITREYTNVIYLKKSENIEDVLTMMGAVNSSIYIMCIKVQKDVKNKINRQMNFESANMNKSIEAGLRQAAAIRLIEKRKGLDFLTDELREIAELRRDNPDMSLKELGSRLSVPISRSGVNHRLNKLLEIAAECESE